MTKVGKNPDMARCAGKYSRQKRASTADRPVFAQVFPGGRPDYRAFFITLLDKLTRKKKK